MTDERIMEEPLSAEQLSRRVWLIGHSPPIRWSSDLAGVLDSRHPTRHSIWTSVAEQIQDVVFDEGPRMRLDTSKLLFRNAFCSAQDTRPKLDLSHPAIKRRRLLLSAEIKQYQPPVIITFGDEAFRFIGAALSPDAFSRRKMGMRDLGDAFRNVVSEFSSLQVNVFPLLHASVARASWSKAGEMFSGSDKEDNYFAYVGRRLGKLFLTHGRSWPIWR